MADQTNPPEVTVTEPTPVAASTTTTTTTVEPKKSSALPKVLLVLVAVICLCLLCMGVAYFLFINVLNKTADALNNVTINEMSNTTNNPAGTSETGTPDADNYDTDLNGTEGNFSIGTSIPAGFPSDVPIYSGATASFSSSNLNDEGKMETAVTFTLNGSANDIIAFYKSEMAAGGYELTSEINLFGNMMTFENAEQEVAVSVIGSTESSDVVLTIVAMEK